MDETKEAIEQLKRDHARIKQDGIAFYYSSGLRTKTGDRDPLAQITAEVLAMVLHDHAPTVAGWLLEGLEDQLDKQQVKLTQEFAKAMGGV